MGDVEDSHPGFSDKLEEGRIALHQLEKHLKDQQRSSEKDDTASVGSRQQSLRSERSALDQISRESRMHYRKDSPLGLTVEELDDRGLLDGGSVPRYYTSIRQKGRRSLELRKRDARIQERNKEGGGGSRSFEVFFHMIRTLAKRGVRIEEYCRQYDTDDNGMVDKRRFLAMVKNMGLPLSHKDVLEIAQCYTVRDTDMVDFDGVLRDSRVLELNMAAYHDSDGHDNHASGLDFASSQDIDSDRDGNGNGKKRSSSSSNGNVDSGGCGGNDTTGEGGQRACTGVLPDVKRMLVDSVRSLGKQVGDVYQMFARWDNQGTGTVTATQFLRVLVKLHVHLSDDDQDFLVELLDANAQGRVNFESLLSFCFNDEGSSGHGTNAHSTRNRDGIASGMCMTGAGAMAGEELSLREADEMGDGGETVSAVSIEGLQNEQNEQKSVASSGNPVNSSNNNNGGSSSSGPVRRPHTASLQRKKSLDQEESRAGNDNCSGEKEGTDAQSSKPQRPLTASARVHSSKQQDWEPSPEKGQQNKNRDSHVGVGEDDEQERVEVDLGDDHEYDDVDPGPLGAGGAAGSAADAAAAQQGAVAFNNSVEGGASFNDNTLATQQDGFGMGSPSGVGAGMGVGVSYGEHSHGPGTQRVQSGGALWNSTSLDGLTATGSQEGLQIGDPESMYTGTQLPFPLVPPSHADGLGPELVTSEPTEHLRLVVEQTLRTVHGLIASRQKTGRNLREIFRHFDRSDSGYIDSEDFLIACRELNVEVPLEVSRLCVESIGIDDHSHSNVSFGEFCVFVQDTEHSVLQGHVQSQICRQLELQGRRYNDVLYTVFWEEEEKQAKPQHRRFPVPTGTSPSYQEQSGYVSSEAFARALSRVGLQLAKTDLRRLVTRYDVHGQGECSVERFLRMIQTSQEWKKAEVNLTLLEGARQEAVQLLQQMKAERTNTTMGGVTKEVISMAEYLGIRPISESGMLWIAADALNAPLPVSWTAQSDASGRTFFYNHVARESTWDHPLDPYFRNLRDKHRREGVGVTENSGEVFSSPSRSPQHPQHHKPLNLSLSRGAGPSPASTNAHNANIRQGGGSGAYASGGFPEVNSSSRRTGSAGGNLGSSGNGPYKGTQYAHTTAVLHASIEKQERLHLPPAIDSEWAAEPNTWKGKSESRPVSAPSNAARKKHYKKSQQIYNSEYFNLNHYKQGGYNVDQIDAANKNVGKLPLGRPQSGNAQSKQTTRARAASAGVRRQPQSGSTRHVHMLQQLQQQLPQQGGHSEPARPAAASFGTYGAPEQQADAEFDKGTVVDRAVFGTVVPTYLQPKVKAEHFVPHHMNNKSGGAANANVNTIIHGNYHRGETTMHDRLEQMYNDDVLARLDQVVMPAHTGLASSAHTSHGHSGNPSAPSVGKTKKSKSNTRGGIVLI